MKTDNKQKRKSLNQVLSEYPAYIEKLQEENKKLKAINDSLLNALKEVLGVDIAEGREKFTVGDLPHEEIKRAKEVIKKQNNENYTIQAIQ